MKQMVLIIGAGPAGLTAGYELLHRFGQLFDVYIIEKNSQVGGIARTVHNGNFCIDIGGHRYFSRDQSIIQWWKNQLPAGDLMRVSRHSKILYNGRFLDYPLTLNPSTLRSVGVIQGTGIVNSYLKAKAHPISESSLENFYINRFGRRLYDLFFAGYTEKVWGRSASEIPPDWGYQRVKGLSVSGLLSHALFHKASGAEVTLTDHFYYPRYGSGSLWETVAKDIRDSGGKILLGETVTNIHLCNNRATSVSVSNGSVLMPDYILSSMPLRDLVSVIDDMPKSIVAVASGLEYRALVIVGLMVRRDSFYQTHLERVDQTIIKDQWLYIQDTSVKLGRIQLFDNWSSCFQYPDAVCLGLEFFCNVGDPMWSMPDISWKTLALTELKSLKLICEEAQVMDVLVHKEPDAYPCYSGAYAQFDSIKSFISETKNIICIGRNGQHRYNNMDHSMASAIKAVQCIAGAGSPEEIWDVNNDKTYNEFAV